MIGLREIIKTVLLTIVLSILTQVGGLIYLIYKPFGLSVKRRIENKLKSRLARLGIFSGIFVVFSLLIIPQIAKHFGRVNLPIISSREIPLGPANFLTVLGNRHYVKPELKELMISVSKQINKKYPGTKILYLDANFPIIDDFPLLPHLSHDDGEKLDIGFIYKDSSTGERINKSPTLFGYGYTEGPKKGEFDQIRACEGKGNWQYSLLSKLVRKKKKYEFDGSVNKVLIEELSKRSRIGKIFIEPHLKNRLGLSQNSKIRFHGCYAVRHDDHIHLQLN